MIPRLAAQLGPDSAFLQLFYQDYRQPNIRFSRRGWGHTPELSRSVAPTAQNLEIMEEKQ
jgi:hypothetical protein